jgi:acyl dehydratase
MKYFEDFRVGERATAAAEYLVTEAEIIEFGTRFDPQPFHTDPVAAKASIFGSLVASSVHLFAMSVSFSRHLGAPTAAVSALGFDEMRMLAPARPGDRLFLRSETLMTRPSQSRPECGIVESRSELFNQRDETVMTYRGAFLVLRREASAEAVVRRAGSFPGDDPSSGRRPPG